MMQTSAVCRRYVDLPPMFGPVRIISWHVDPFSTMSFGTNGSAASAARRPDGAVDDGELVAVVDVRLDVVADRGSFGERGEHVERRQRARRGLDARRLGGDLPAQPLEDLELALEDALVGAEHLLLVLLERRRDEALATGDRLLAVVVGRHRVEVRLRDLDVVAEHAVVADLERADAGARALALFHARR